MNKKKIRNAVIISLCAVLAAAPAVGATVYYARGNIKSAETTDEFKKGLSENASTTDNVRVMSANLLVGYDSWGGLPVKPRAKMFAETIGAYKPDVIGLQEICDGWFCALRNLPDGYKLLYPLSTGATVTMTALAYNSDTLELIEKGKTVFEEGNNPRLRRVVWGLFEVKATGKRFVATSTHFDLMSSDDDTEKAEIMKSESEKFLTLSNELCKKYNCPVISTGDYNAMEQTPETREMDAPFIYDYLAENLTDCKLSAREKFAGDAWTLEQPTYDHIFLNGDCEVERFEILSQKYYEEMSDHFPIFADFKL